MGSDISVQVLYTEFVKISENPKIRKSKILKIQKSKIRKSKNPKSENPKVLVPNMVVPPKPIQTTSLLHTDNSDCINRENIVLKY